MNNKIGDFEMYSINTKGGINEAQQTDKEKNPNTKEKEKINARDMDHIEKTLLQNQKALSQTLSDVQNKYTTTLNGLLQNNSTLSNRIAAIEIQLQGIQIRIANLSGNGPTTVTEKTGS
jgi:uncharacterized protein YlxW (UPF0749 family)